MPGAELAELGFMGILSRPLLLFSLPGIPTLLGLVLFCIKRADRGLVLLDESPSNKLEALQPEKNNKEIFSRQILSTKQNINKNSNADWSV